MCSLHELRQRYHQVRKVSVQFCKPLAIDDYQVQSIVETSPPKWHLAHVTWFFETFLLKAYVNRYKPYHPRFEYLFNSYYETVGQFHPRSERGLLARPTVEEVYAYRRAVDEAMDGLFEVLQQSPDEKILFFVELGIHHEQQHQELLCMDIKHNFSVNPLRPTYRGDLAGSGATTTYPVVWCEQEAGLYGIGHEDQTFAYDNELPRHQQYLHGFRLANRMVTNEEYLAFMDDDGYQRPELWLADGWHYINKHRWRHPLYWQCDDRDWSQMTLAGMRDLNAHEPVCHVSYFEADAYARWAGKRLASEAEQEVVLAQHPVEGNFFDQDRLHPSAAPDTGQWFGDLWTWTSTAYHPYPGYQPLPGSPGEYNGKFMCNQMILRGGACVTSLNHMRASYRNFFYPHDRWQFSGIRLAENQ